MKVIVLANNKGGVGKTKTSDIISEYLSIVLKKRVLEIDLDAQANLSRRRIEMMVDPVFRQGFMPPIHPDYDPDEPMWSNWPDGRSSIADIFYGQPILPYPTAIENLDIAPAHAEKLLSAEAVRRNEVVEKVYDRLDQFLNLEDVRQSYDVVLIDTAPSKGPLTVSAIRAATHLIIPCVMEDKAIQGMYGMLQLWTQESLRRSADKPLNLVGVLPTLFRSVNLHEDMLNSLKATESISQYILPVMFKQRTVYAELDVSGTLPNSIFNLNNSNPAKQEAMEVCQHIAQRIFNHD
jgi:chromosome partitioning protein